MLVRIRSRINFRKAIFGIAVVFVAGLLIHNIRLYSNTIVNTRLNLERLKSASYLIRIETNNSNELNIDVDITENEKVSELTTIPKKILIWNTYWKSRALWNKVFTELIHGQCPIRNCILTMNKQELNSSDAVLFHLVDFHNNAGLPERRNPNQIWIAMTYEPPSVLNQIGFNFSKLNGVFNRTMSYRKDSDIVVRHGKYLPIQENGDQNPNFPKYISNWVNSIDDSKVRNYAQGKKRLVAWFASSRNCRSNSGREIYIKQLQEHLEVDIYGSCGPYKCGSTKTIRNAYEVEQDNCYYLVSMAYKFVLAFENSICDDYVTEKLYNNLKLNVIPVVFGGSNYSYYAPPHSVIEANEMTPSELASYLLLLDKNDTLYNEYFLWKKNYYIVSHDGVPMACELCEKLNDPIWGTEKNVYQYLEAWISINCHAGYGNGTPLLV